MTSSKAFVSIPRCSPQSRLSAGKAGLDHLGIQAEDGAELEELGSLLAQADLSDRGAKVEQTGGCCAPEIAAADEKKTCCS